MAKVSKFYSSYNEPETKSSPLGDGYINQYKIEIIDGVEVLVKQKERRNLQAEIEAAAPSCDVASIIEKFIDTGDESLINKVPTMYGDFTDAPKSLLEAKQRLYDAQRSFDELSPRVKALFDNDVNKFMADEDPLKRIQDFYNGKLSSKVDVPAQTVGEGVKESVNNVQKEASVNE